jgi:hypothetical protein
MPRANLRSGMVIAVLEHCVCRTSLFSRHQVRRDIKRETVSPRFFNHNISSNTDKGVLVLILVAVNFQMKEHRQWILALILMWKESDDHDSAESFSGPEYP